MSLSITAAGWAAPGRENWDQFRGHVETRRPPEHDWFDAATRLGERGNKYLSNATRYLLAATYQAVGKVDPRPESLKDRIGIVVGTNLADYWVRRDIDLVVREHGAAALNAIEAPNTAVNLPASHVAVRLGYTGPNITITNQHLAGLEAFYVADRLMRRHRLASMMCGAVEDGCNGSGSAAGGATMFVMEEGCFTDAPCLARIESIDVAFLPGNPVEPDGRMVEALRQRSSGAPAMWLMSNCHETANRISRLLEPKMLAPLRNLAHENESFGASHTLLPLLQLIWLIANGHEGQVIAVSPLGHVVMFNLKKGDR